MNTGAFSPAPIGLVGLWDGINTVKYFASALGARATHYDRVGQIASADCSQYLVVDPRFDSPAVLRDVRGATIAVMIDVHQQLDIRLAYARYFDHVFIAQPEYLEAFRALGHPSVHYLPLACDPAVHFKAGLTRDIDVGFVGKFGAEGSEREQVLRAVLSSFATNDTSRGYSPAEMGEIYSRSKIVFNKSINRDLNMRFFEGLAAGALLVTDRIGNGLADAAEEGIHYIGYDTAEEAIEKIRFYLEHDEERLAIAARGQTLAFERHTYAARTETMLAAVAEHPSVRAPARSTPPVLEAQWRSECLRIQGASVAQVLVLLATSAWSVGMMSNAAVAAARGVVRPLRQSLKRLRAGR
jgi:hypothetical protein